MTKVRVTAAIMDFTEDAFLKDEKNTLNVKVDTEGKVNEKQNEENPEEKAEKRIIFTVHLKQRQTIYFRRIDT